MYLINILTKKKKKSLPKQESQEEMSHLQQDLCSSNMWSISAWVRFHSSTSAASCVPEEQTCAAPQVTIEYLAIYLFFFQRQEKNTTRKTNKIWSLVTTSSLSDRLYCFDWSWYQRSEQRVLPNRKQVMWDFPFGHTCFPSLLSNVGRVTTRLVTVGGRSALSRDVCLLSSCVWIFSSAGGDRGGLHLPVVTSS